MLRRVLVTALVLSFLSAATLSAQEAPTKQQRIREMLILMRSGELGLQVLDQMIETMKRTMPGAPEEFWTSFRQKVKAEELVDLLVPVYDKNLEAGDVEEAIRFFSSPAGRRFVERQPVILEESMAAGQRWGEEIARRALEELQKSRPK